MVPYIYVNPINFEGSLSAQLNIIPNSTDNHKIKPLFRANSLLFLGNFHLFCKTKEKGYQIC